jgi:hypothetical protein
MYSKNMSQAKLARFFEVDERTFATWRRRGIDFWAIYDAFHNLKTLHERKRYLYDNNPERKNFLNKTENFLDIIWENHINKIEMIKEEEEKRYESGNTHWKLNKRFGI